ncbi:MAG: dihydroneopterin aldolase [Alphaproteobacteria bacterium]
MTKQFFKLSILDLRVWLHLGCSDQERFNPQLVSFNIELEFKEAPKGSSTDTIEDTVCFATLAQAIKSFCQTKQFHLIEHLGAEVHQVVAKSLGQHIGLVALINVTVHKIAPPVPDLHGGAVFTYCSPPA